MNTKGNLVNVWRLTCSSVFLLLLMIGANHSYGQSGWTKKKGELFAKLYGSTGSSTNYYNLSGNKLTTSKFTQSTFGFYAEYGLTDKFTILVNGPVIKSNGFETTNQVTAVGDLPLGIKYSLARGKFPLAVSLVADIPLAKPNNFAQNKNISFEQINLPTGDGEWNFLGTLALSHAFDKFPAYTNLYGQFNYRTAFEGTDFSNQLCIGVEAGLKIKGKYWLTGALHVQESLGESLAVDFVRGEGTAYTGYRFGAFIPIYKEWGIDISYSNYTDLIVARKNVYSAGVVSLGIVYDLKK